MELRVDMENGLLDFDRGRCDRGGPDFDGSAKEELFKGSVVVRMDLRVDMETGLLDFDHGRCDRGGLSFDRGRFDSGRCTFAHMDRKYNNSTDNCTERLQLHCSIAFLLMMRRDSSTSVYPEGRYPSHHLYMFSCHVRERQELF